MIPKNLDGHLRANLPQSVIENRLIRDNGMCFVEFGHTDEHLLLQLGITIDKLGPTLVVCMWNEVSPLPIGGYLVVDNLSMGSPSMGGIRMLTDITPMDIHNLARGMTLKNGAANLPYGGGKSGIVAGPNLGGAERTKVVRGFARLLRRYRDIYVPGPDVGTNDNDMRTIAVENGLDYAVSKTADMGGNRIDELGAAAGGVVIALSTLLQIMPRLGVLPQFSDLEIPRPKDVTVLFQGFGAVGAHAARILTERLPEAKTIGISDLTGYLYSDDGLPVDTLFNLWEKHGMVSRAYYEETIAPAGDTFPAKFSTDANNLLRESAFCFVPAASVFNYLGVFPAEKASMNVNHMGDWSVIVEGANCYSPDPNRKAARIRMEQIVYRQKGVMIANDYLVNSGGVIFAAQEHMIPTPAHLQIPGAMLGDHKAVDGWLSDHAGQFEKLSQKRLAAGELYREEVIRRNMIELVALLAADPDLLPCAAAEQVSLRRLTNREIQRTAGEIMISMQTISMDAGVQEAAAMIVKGTRNIIAVLDAKNRLAGVVTAWDIAGAVAEGDVDNINLKKVMTRRVVTISPDDTIPDILRVLEQHQISALPVVDDDKVLGMINSDLLAHRYLMEIMKE